MKIGEMRVGFIGAGKVGCSLGRLFREKGLPVVGYVSRHDESADSAAILTASHHFATLGGLVAESDILFLTVPDGSIAEVWKELQKYPLEGKLACHCSGSLPAAVLENAANICLGGCSLHPLYAVSSREEAWNLLEQCGFDEDTARLALAPLLSGNMAKLVEQGAERALTGPMERNDATTVARHLGVLKNEQREIYRLLSMSLLDIASRKHPERDMETMRELLRS